MREEGTNGDRELGVAFHLTGRFEPVDVCMSDLLAGTVRVPLPAAGSGGSPRWRQCELPEKSQRKHRFHSNIKYRNARIY